MGIAGVPCAPAVDGRSAGLRERCAGGPVLVTGARGFLGRHLARRLQGAGVVPVRLVRQARADPASAGDWVGCELLDRPSVDREIARLAPSLVFHLAGFASGAPSIDAARLAIESNALATANLLFAVAEFAPQARVVLPGTLETSSATLHRPEFSSPYGASKAMAEINAKLVRDHFEVEVVTARIGTVYGPDDPNLRRLVPHVVRSLLSGYPPDLSSGERMADWIYVDDAIDGLMAIAAAGGPLPASVDVGTGALRSVRDVAEAARAAVGTDLPLGFGRLPDRPGEPYAADADAAERVTGWRARVGLEQGIALTVDWHRRAIGAGRPRATA